MDQPTEKFELPTEKALELYEAEFWKPMSFRERALFQMYCDKLCMPFDVFHEAVEKALGRGVYTHEFALNRDGLIQELNGEAPAPSLGDIINLIPEDKRIIVMVAEKEEGNA